MLRRKFAPAAILTGVLAGITGAKAHISEIRVDAIEPFAESAPFGKTGPYVRIRGIAKGEIDPKAPENQVIADLEKAPRNERGMVAYETDFFILRPADAGKSNGVLLYDVTNRGRKFHLHWIDEAPNTSPAAINDPKTVKDAGIGFTLSRGYTLVWSGWDPDAPKTNNGMTVRVPVATNNGAPIVRRIREEFQIGTRGPANVEIRRLNYPAASTDKAKARLTIRSREADARTEIPAEGWEFADNNSIRLLPKDTKFSPIKIYELWYPATTPKIVGLGYAATRDLVAFLRYERTDRKGVVNPLDEAATKHAIAIGISQSGRYLRHHLELGMNKDEFGRRVFDGVLAHISGAGKVFANHTFAEPGRTATQHEDRYYPENWFPFSAAAATDPFTGQQGALLRGDASDPLLIETNTSTEYWQKGASLLHIDPTGKEDLKMPANARVYLIAGTQHGGRANQASTPGACVNARNPHNPAPALRALLVALEEWVTKGVEPPASRVPSLAQGTAVDAQTIKMPVVKGFAHAPGANRIGAPVDWIDPPAGAASAGKFYGIRVPAVDADGNEVAGIRLPPIAVPIATYAGWNVYKAEPGELCDRDGTYLPLAKTKADRGAASDPRPSLEERYGSHDAYVAKVKAAADALVAERLLLQGDAARYVKAAQTSERF